jgi:PAS domain S-box-containing protein
MILNPQSVLFAAVNVSSQKLLDRIPHLAWLMSERGEILATNQLWCEYIGRSPADEARLVASSASKIMATVATEPRACNCCNTFLGLLEETERDRFALLWAVSSAALEPLEIKLRLMSTNGEWEWFKVELEPDRDRSGEITWIGTAQRLGGAVMLPLSASWEPDRLDRVERDRQRLGVAFEISKVGAWYWELADNNLYWTREFEILFDYEPGSTQRTYSEWSQRVHPDDLQRVEHIFQETLAGRLPQHRCEYRIVCRDGSIRWMDGIGEIGTDEEGNVYLSGLIADITDRKRDEEALRRSQEFQQRILASNNDCIKVFDLAGRLMYMNHGGLTMLEIDDFNTIANQPWRDLWQGHETDKIDTALDTARSGTTARFEGFCPTATGKSKWWEVIVTPILDAEGRVEQILSVSRDITDRRQAAAALQASEKLFRNTFEYTPIGFAHVLPQGRLIRVNRKFCEIIGYSEAELLKLTFQDITEPADLAEDVALVNQLLNDEIQEYTLEKRYIHKQGHHVWVCLTVSLVREIAAADRIGAPSYFLSAVQDITRRKQLEATELQQTAELQQLNISLLLTQQQLKERNQELDNFVRIASHDLKAPLRAIANLSDWIEEDMSERLTDDDRQQFKLLRGRVKRMDALIDGLLRYSRLGTETIAIETVDVAQLVTETIDSLAPPPTFEIAILSPLPTLAIKRILFSQVLANLLSNAIKHHHRATGLIEITAEDLGDRYQFSIADDGPGIPLGEARERIFEIFETLKPSSSTENTGIGLAVVKKIIEGEGGQIWLEIDRAQGTCFCFTWPKV